MADQPNNFRQLNFEIFAIKSYDAEELRYSNIAVNFEGWELYCTGSRGLSILWIFGKVGLNATCNCFYWIFMNYLRNENGSKKVL